MDKALNWSQCQVFLAVAETGSLSAAASRLGLTQPTVGRQIKALEAGLGQRLFDRHARGLRLTEVGQDLLPAAQTMQAAAHQMALKLAGQDAAPSGTVRVTASVFMAHFALPPILADLRQRHPAIQIEVVATDQVENLLFREADIAVRMVRPQQLDMVTRHIGDLSLGMFAARGYLERRGVPETLDDLRGHDLIGYDRSDLILQGFRAFGIPVKPSDFAIRCDNQSAYLQFVKAGCGIGVGQVQVAARDPDLVRILPNLPLPSLPMWLTTHPDLRHTRKVATVWDALDHALGQICHAAPP